MLTKAELPECPVATTLQLIGNKWKMLILRNLMGRPWRFNEMLRSIPAVIFLTGYTQYAVEAFALHASGYLMKPISREKLSAEVEYALSGLGETMRPIIKAMEAWGTEYQQKVREGG